MPERIAAEGPRRATVGLLTGCIQQAVSGPHNRATARVLARNGLEVVAPRAQTFACGLRPARTIDAAIRLSEYMLALVADRFGYQAAQELAR